ncbi:MAG: dockerin type I domain-containing protein, partial [Euryarchaeota archaeon]|nr:dockerin type I domain-containing protein [Euryarchaeota archaeon]
DLKGDNNDFSVYCSDGFPNNGVIEFTDRRIFAENYANTDPHYYLDESTISIEEEGVKTIRYYPLTAIPSSGSADVIVNKFDTSLSRGETLVDITANTINENEVVFTIDDLTSGTNYLVKRDGVDFATKQANSAGHTEFINSEWSSAHRFTVVESDTSIPLVANLRNDRPAQNTVTLRWDCSSPDIDHYTIHEDVTRLDTTGNKYYRAINLTQDTTYTFKVSATNKNGITGDSVSITVRTEAEESFGSNTLHIAEDVTASKGSYVTVPIMIHGATGVACDGVNLSYNASVVNVVDVTQGDFTTYFGFNDGSAADGWVTINTYVSETALTGGVKVADVMLKTVGDAGDSSPLDMEIIAMTDQNGYPVSGTVSNGLFTVVSDTSPPIVADLFASQLIPDDTDGVPSWGEAATLNVTVTDESGVAGVIIDLSAIGGSPVQPMTCIGDNIWSVTTNASAGTPPHMYELPVCATDIYGYTNMQESVELVVMRNGDVTGDNDVTLDDVALMNNYVTYGGRYTISSEFVADVTDDGAVNIADAMMLANYVANQDQHPIRCVESTY